MVSLPLSGIPGWREGNHDPAFVATAECFRGRDPARCYAPAVRLAGARVGDPVSPAGVPCAPHSRAGT
jgi:acetyl esterase/lipase